MKIKLLFSIKAIIYFDICRRDAEVQMEGQFLVRQIYEDEITYNLITAAVNILSKNFVFNFTCISVGEIILCILALINRFKHYLP